MSAMASIHITAAERVTNKLHEQASAHKQIAALHLVGKVTDDSRRHATEHTETARLFGLLWAACATGGLLDRLQDEALTAVTK